MWTHTLHDPWTGALFGPIELSASSTTRLINASSTGKHTAIVGTGSPWGPLLCSPREAILASAWDGVCKYAGYLETVTGYDPATSALSFTTLDVRGSYAPRFLYLADDISYRAGKLEITGQSYAGAIGIILERIQHRQVPLWNLPLLSPAITSGTFDRTYNYWDFWTAEKALTEIQELDDGPDIDFTPTYTSDGSLTWVCRVGSPRLASSSLEQNLGAPGNGISVANFQINAQSMRTGQISVGAGSEADMVVAFANLVNTPDLQTGPAIPYIDYVESSLKQITDPQILEDHARADLRGYRRPIEQWSYSIEADTDGCNLRDIVPGSRLRVWTVGHPKYVDGWRDSYVIGIETDLSTTAKISVQPYWTP
ncbi:hypothetical protein NCPPB3778_17 [Rathayibacter phage NCPPB3778]|nr:hypothetical protein NCPPB3778_17 [Rathayibacter phage NCPPB3778]